MLTQHAAQVAVLLVQMSMSGRLLKVRPHIEPEEKGATVVAMWTHVELAHVSTSWRLAVACTLGAAARLCQPPR